MTATVPSDLRPRSAFSVWLRFLPCYLLLRTGLLWGLGRAGWRRRAGSGGFRWRRSSGRGLPRRCWGRSCPSPSLWSPASPGLPVPLLRNGTEYYVCDGARNLVVNARFIHQQPSFGLDHDNVFKHGKCFFHCGYSSQF